MERGRHMLESIRIRTLSRAKPTPEQTATQPNTVFNTALHPLHPAHAAVVNDIGCFAGPGGDSSKTGNDEKGYPTLGEPRWFLAAEKADQSLPAGWIRWTLKRQKVDKPAFQRGEPGFDALERIECALMPKPR
jgi:hypothetical protein